MKHSYKLLLLGLFVLLITILVVVDTYGLFETNGSADKELDIADWTILLNDVNVSESKL